MDKFAPFTYQDLVQLLETYNVDMTKWGTETFKTINDLFNELNNDDCYMSIEHDKLVRYVSVVYILIVKGDYVLMEKEQTLCAGRKRIRNLPLAEKIIPPESLDNAIVRGIHEELLYIGNPYDIASVHQSAFEVKINNLADEDNIKCTEEIMESKSYPNLLCKYKKYVVECEVNTLPSSEFTSFEIRNDKYLITNWHWVKINDAINLNEMIKLYYQKP